MQHGHPSLSTVHHHSALSAWKKLAQYVAQGSEAVEFPIAALLISDAVDFFVHLGRDRQGRRAVTEICEVAGWNGNEVQLNRLFVAGPDGRGIPQPHLTDQRRTKLREHGFEDHLLLERRRVVDGVTARRLLGRARRRRASASASSLAVAGWFGLLDRPPRARRVAPAADGRRLLVRGALLVVGAQRSRGWWTRWPVAAAARRARRLAGPDVRRPAGPAGGGSWPAPRRSPSGPRCSATCSCRTPGCTRRSASRRGSRPTSSATRCAPCTSGPSAATSRGAGPVRRRHGRCRSPTPSSRRCRSPTSGPCPTSASCSPRSPRRRARRSPCSCGSTPPAPARTARRSSSPASSRSSSGCSSLTNRTYMEPFGTFAGQIVLVGVVAARGRALWGDGRALAAGARRAAAARRRPAPSTGDGG